MHFLFVKQNLSGKKEKKNLGWVLKHVLRSHHSLEGSVFFSRHGGQKLVWLHPTGHRFAHRTRITLEHGSRSVHTEGSHAGQSDRELKGQRIPSGTRHTEALISPISGSDGF